jgi:hypothetical protein
VPRVQGDATKGEGFSLIAFDKFRDRYQESGKPLNEDDWAKAAVEAIILDISAADMAERVIPTLVAELSLWKDLDVGLIPFPANWLKSQPWTRKSKPLDPSVAWEQCRQRD